MAFDAPPRKRTSHRSKAVRARPHAHADLFGEPPHTHQPLQRKPGVWKKRETDRLGKYRNSQQPTRDVIPQYFDASCREIGTAGELSESWNKGRDRSSPRYYRASSYSTRHRFCAVLARLVPVFQLLRERWYTGIGPVQPAGFRPKGGGSRQLVLSRNSARSLEL